MSFTPKIDFASVFSFIPTITEELFLLTFFFLFVESTTMGRITVFTSDDLNSKVVLNELEKRRLPFTEISLVEHPSKRLDLKALTGTMSVPKVFFNTRSVAGVEAILKELRRWDSSSQFKNALEKYKATIGNEQDPLNPQLTLPDSEPVRKKVHLFPEIVASIELLDGTKTTFHDITEKLKNSLPITDSRVNGTYFRNVVTGQEAAETFKKTMMLSTDEAMTFGTRILEAKVIHQVATENPSAIFRNSDKTYYRLQCHMTPDILNSYKEWEVESSMNVIDLLDVLDDLLNDIESQALDDNGMLDYAKASSSERYHLFEEAVCQLQTAEISDLFKDEMLAFGINLYRLMIRYAFIKVGISLFEADRLHFLNSVKFMVGFHLFTMSEWIDGILRSNKKSTLSGGKVPFGRLDPRRRLALSNFDHRIHFALNSGHCVGSHFSTPFRKFCSVDIEAQLDTAALVFWQDPGNLKLDAKTGTILLPKPIGWYRSDFGKDDEALLESISGYLTGNSKALLRKFTASGDKIMVAYENVNWGQSACHFQRYEKEVLAADEKGLKAFVRRFLPPKKTANEEIRMGALHSLNILDTLPEERFDRITRMVQEHFAVPLVFISLVDTDRQWFKSKQWACTAVPEASETSRDVSFCGHAIHKTELMIIPDALLDDRFADNPLVQGPLSIRFYAGCPLKVPAGDGSMANIGTLCIIDHRPRDFSDQEQADLRNFASQVKKEILRRDSNEKV